MEREGYLEGQLIQPASRVLYTCSLYVECGGEEGQCMISITRVCGSYKTIYTMSKPPH